MAAPVFAQWYVYSFRDSKGNTSRMKVLIGGASTSAVETESQTLKTAIQATTNAHVSLPLQDGPDHTYGTTAAFATVEDKAILSFTDVGGRLHRYQLPAPKVAGFNTDTETVLASETNMAALISAFNGNVYGAATDTSPLTFIGGTRIRRKMHRKATIWDKDPTLTVPEE